MVRLHSHRLQPYADCGPGTVPSCHPGPHLAPRTAVHLLPVALWRNYFPWYLPPPTRFGVRPWLSLVSGSRGISRAPFVGLPCRGFLPGASLAVRRDALPGHRVGGPRHPRFPANTSSRSSRRRWLGPCVVAPAEERTATTTPPGLPEGNLTVAEPPPVGWRPRRWRVKEKRRKKSSKEEQTPRRRTRPAACNRSKKKQDEESGRAQSQTT